MLYKNHYAWACDDIVTYIYLKQSEDVYIIWRGNVSEYQNGFQQFSFMKMFPNGAFACKKRSYRSSSLLYCCMTQLNQSS